jgi:hypothetical protein
MRKTNIIILIFIILLISCSDIALYESEQENLIFIMYCAKESSQLNQIYYHYPQLNEDNKINELIINHVRHKLDALLQGTFSGNIKDSSEEWQWDDSTYDSYAMYVNYEITLFDDLYLSIIFEGLFNYRKSANPLHYFSSLIIDIQKKEIINISDIYNINDDFIRIALESLKKEIRDRGVLDEFKEITYLHISEYLQKALQSDGGNEYIYHSFLTIDAIGISVPVSYTLGSHWKIYIDKKDL